MKTSLEEGERIIRESAANMQRGIEAVGGRLYLTSGRLIFESHAMNVQTGNTSIALGDVVGAEKCWTKFLNLIPLFPNSIVVKTGDGNEARFVVSRRNSWIEDLSSGPPR